MRELALLLLLTLAPGVLVPALVDVVDDWHVPDVRAKRNATAKGNPQNPEM